MYRWLEGFFSEPLELAADLVDTEGSLWRKYVGSRVAIFIVSNISQTMLMMKRLPIGAIVHWGATFLRSNSGVTGAGAHV